MLSAIFTSVADALISYAIDKLDPAERIKSWLRLDPARLAFKKALARAYSAFARQYPEYTSSLFDQSFLSTEALPELSKLITRNQHPDPAMLAQAWGRSLGASVDFSQAATKPAAYFLERFEAELKAEPALHPIFDSRALESLPKLEAEIQKLSAELQRGLDTALKASADYQKITLHIDGDVKDSNIIIGDNNVINKYYYSGDFISLNEYYIPPDGVFQRVRVNEFIGRDWLTAKVDTFLNDPQRKSGAFLLIGDAGVGKTSFMAHLVKERRYLHLFAEQVPGQAMLQRALQSLGSQLVTRYQIDPYKDRDTLNVLAGFPDFLERLLRLAASTLTEGEKIVIVCDALDEAGTFPDHFVFGLPKELPDGVYLILSQRPVNTKLPNFEPLRFDLEAQGEDNLQDMEDYLRAVAKRPVVAGQIHGMDYSEDFFIQTLKEKSQGVWMYLHYVIKEIERGQRAPMDLESLPKGLVGYYADYWDNWRSGRKGSDATKWDSLYAPLLATLAAAQEAITVDQLIEWAGVQTSPHEVTRLLSESWSSFITEKEEKNKTVYTLYHQSLRDFITGKVEDIKKLPPTYASLVSDLSKKKVEAHQRIVNVFEKECKGKWEILVGQDYPRLHLTAHLNGAGEYEKLRILLTEGDEKIKWAEAREKKEETYAGYLNDLTYVWDCAEREQNYALAIRCMLVENSIHSLASNISFATIFGLGVLGIWSHEKCLSIIRQKPEARDQAKSIKIIAQHLPKSLLDEAMSIALITKDKDAIEAVISASTTYFDEKSRIRTFSDIQQISDEYLRTELLIKIVPQLSEKLQLQIISAAPEIKDENYRSRLLSSMAPYLSEEIKFQIIFDDQIIKNKKYLANTLSSYIPYCGKKHKTLILQKILLIAQSMKDDFDCFHIISGIAPAITRTLYSQILSIIYKMKSELYRSLSLRDIIPYLDKESIDQIFIHLLEFKEAIHCIDVISKLAPRLTDKQKKQALLFALKIKDESIRVHVVSVLYPYLNKALKNIAFSESLSTIKRIRDEREQSSLINAIFPHLSDNQKNVLLSLTQNIRSEFFRADALIKIAKQTNNRDLREQILQDALLATQNIDDEGLRATKLADFSPYFNETIKSKIFLATCEINDEYGRANSLSALTPFLSKKMKRRVFFEAIKIQHEPSCTKVLAALAPHLDKDLQIQAINTIRNIKDIKYRNQLVFDFLPYLNRQKATKLILNNLSAELHIGDDSGWASALIALLPYISDQLISSAYLKICNIKTDYVLARLLQEVMPYINNEQKTQSYSVVKNIPNKIYQVRALAAVIPHLKSNLRTKATQDIISSLLVTQDATFQSDALTVIFPFITEKQKIEISQKIFSSAEGTVEMYQQNLSILAPYLNKDLIIQFCKKAISNFRKTRFGEELYYFFSTFNPLLDEQTKRQIAKELKSTLKESDHDYLSMRLSSLFPSLFNKNLASRLINTPSFGKDDRGFANALSSIAPYLNKEGEKRVLLIINKFGEEWHRSEILVAIAPKLRDENKDLFLQAVQEIGDETVRAYTLHDLTPYLSRDLEKWAKLEIKNTILNIRDKSERATLLIKFVPSIDIRTKISVLKESLFISEYSHINNELISQWSKIEFEGLKELLFKCFRYISRKDREKGLESLSALTPALVQFSSADIAPELYRSITDVTRWWP